MTINRVNLTANRINREPAPADGRSKLRDAEVPGLYVQTTATGSKSFYVTYKLAGCRKHMQLGRWPDMSIRRARELARDARGVVTEGRDPAAAKRDRKEAATMQDLWERYWDAHGSRKRSGNKDRQRRNKYVSGALGRWLAAEVTHEDMVRLHRRVGETVPGTANRMTAMLSKMFSLAERWGVIPRGSNPARGVRHFPEKKIERYLTAADYTRLFEAIHKADAADVAKDALRVLALTGMRATEPLKARASDLDVRRGELLLLETKTGRRRLKLSDAALEILKRRARAAPGKNGFLFPGRKRGSSLSYSKLYDVWLAVRAAANLEDLRMHDLRHSFASVAADEGLSLLEVGGLLGHKTPLTTARYAHLFDESQRKAANTVGGRIAEAAE